MEYQAPQALEAESSILGSMMIDPRVIDDVLISIETDDFYSHANQLIFDEIKTLSEKNQPCDPVTVAESLTDKGRIDEVGGMSVLGGMAKNTPSTGNAKAYCKIVREKSALRKIIQSGQDMINLAMNPEGRTAEDIVNESGAIVTDLNLDSTRNTNRRLDEIFKANLAALEHGFKNKKSIMGVKTGLELIDRRINGLQPEKLIIVAGRPSMGKTTLAMNMLENACLIEGAVVQGFGMEQSGEEFGEKILSSHGRVDFSRIKTPSMLQSDDWPRLTNAVSNGVDKRFFIDDKPAMSLNYIRSVSRKTLAREGRLDAIMVDYLQLMEHAKSARKDLDIGDISRGMKNLARELKCAVILLSQLNRGLESRPDKRPLMSDLRESGSIEQDADVILMLYRDEVYYPESDSKGVAEIICRKNRGGQTGTDRVAWLGNFQRFDNLTGFYDQ